MTRIEWIAFPQQKPSRLERLLIVTYDIGNRPVIEIGWYDASRRLWITSAGPLDRLVTHFAFLPEVPADVLTPAQVRELEAA